MWAVDPWDTPANHWAHRNKMLLGRKHVGSGARVVGGKCTSMADCPPHGLKALIHAREGAIGDC